ncbi:hypothetical protein PUR29_33105 [Methylobacterium ajmalii]|uniref:Uncharacterized protein n=1 Tax=Methylobacterium ajmalii TaxID=2738439 RepID=A0ABV0A375_9HYPH
MTPAEVYAVAQARSDNRTRELQRLAWMTARLTGFSQVPDFEKCFPEKPKPATTADLMAFFSGFDGVKIVKH